VIENDKLESLHRSFCPNTHILFYHTAFMDTLAMVELVMSVVDMYETPGGPTYMICSLYYGNG